MHEWLVNLPIHAGELRFPCPKEFFMDVSHAELAAPGSGPQAVD